MKSIFAAAALCAFTLPSFAIPTSLGTLDDDSAFLSATFAAGNDATTFNKVYSFDLTLSELQDAIVKLTWTDGSIDPAKNMQKLVATLSGGSLSDALLDTNLGDTVGFGSLGAGHYTLTLTGNIVGSKSSSYGGYLTTTPAVPEPSSLALLLAGLSAAAVIGRRQNKR
jgi:hypothetical protein